MKYEFKSKPEKCPSCGGEKIANILYGLPAFSNELMEDIDQGRIVLGGCCITDRSPVWKCVQCEIEIFQRTK